MNACREMRPQLEWLAAGELADGRRRGVEEHVRACPACQRALDSWRTMLTTVAEPPAALQAEIRAIAWDEVTERIMAGIARPDAGRRAAASRSPFAFWATAAALTAVLGLGIFFVTRPGANNARWPGGDEMRSASVSRLQSGLARAEAATYLKQSQVMLSGLLENCTVEEMAPWEMRQASRQARQLLLKKKYFQQHLSAREWSKIRSVSERIDWLSYEILQLEEPQLCDQVSRLQHIMEGERLLLKIRLVESEFTLRPLQEA